MSGQLLKQVIEWWRNTEYLEVYSVLTTKRGIKFIVDIDGTPYSVSIKEVR